MKHDCVTFRQELEASGALPRAGDVPKCEDCQGLANIYRDWLNEAATVSPVDLPNLDDEVAAVLAEFDARTVRPPQKWLSRQTGVGLLAGAALAASTLIIVMPVEQRHVAVPVATSSPPSQINLGSGLNVTTRHGTRISVSPKRGEHQLLLKEGHIDVDYHPAAKRPALAVITPGGVVEVVGTAFGVSWASESSRLSVAVTRGNVAVHTADKTHHLEAGESFEAENLPEYHLPPAREQTPPRANAPTTGARPAQTVSGHQADTPTDPYAAIEILLASREYARAAKLLEERIPTVSDTVTRDLMTLELAKIYVRHVPNRQRARHLLKPYVARTDAVGREAAALSRELEAP